MKTKAVLFASLAVSAALIFTGCSGSVPSVYEPDTKAEEPAVEPSAAPEPEVSEEPVAEEPSMIALFGEVMTYTDGMSISVSPPAAFTPSQYAAGATYPNNFVYTITITNGTTAAFEPFAIGTMISGGVAGESVFDSGNDGVIIDGFPPSAPILPGNTISWNVAFSIADPANMQYSIAPGFEYEDAIFVLTK